MFSLSAYAQAPVTTTVSPLPSGDPKPPFEWSGDIRYRMAQTKEAIDEERKFQQLRVRLGLKAEVNPATKAIIRMATATSAISTNQTLGDSSSPGMARRSFGLDLAYVDWAFHDFGHVWAGRIANPFWSPVKVQTLFDADIAFEGIAAKFEPQWEDGGAFLNLGAFMIAEIYTKPDDVVDTGLAAADLGLRMKHGEFSWTVHAGTYHFLNIQNKPIGRVEASSDVDQYSTPFDRHRGNTVYAPNPTATPTSQRYLFKNQYTLANLGAEARQKVGSGEVGGFFEYIRNYSIGSQATALEAGILGKTGGLTLSIARVQKEADSVVGAFTDSDSNGGGTDNEGYRLQIAYQISKNATFTGSQFEAERGVDTVKRDYRGTQLDFSVSF